MGSNDPQEHSQRSSQRGLTDGGAEARREEYSALASARSTVSDGGWATFRVCLNPASAQLS